ncbi:C4-dicarboxylate transport sensor protein DctB [Pseudoruegeria aquimaris]|uniref:histidine kinase n=1 Tax=Pseudoruegeria aquimaris TaxID=393663 RepID=A0A1Y5R8F0_9RHOB|nr:ATP-binding protein [Pseudoruegeria aquimaris]SLN10465.1 C4-dicarboxylate transport sensor protein DctB [Pseudoruegeria aquimaris]
MARAVQRGQRGRALRPLAFALAAVLVLALVFFGAARILKASEQARAEARLSLYHATLTEALERYSHLPYLLARDPFVQRGTAGIGLAGLNRRLADFAARTNLEAIYLMDPNGLTIAASNYADPVTFIGKSYAFRPYFTEARAGGSGAFFAIGVTTGRPGYFLAEPVRNEAGDITGVIAIKVDVSPIASLWAEGGETLFVSNPDGVVILASDPDWQYHTLAPLPEARRAEIAKARQFADAPLPALDFAEAGPDVARLSGTRYLHRSAPLGRLSWRLHYLAPERVIWAGALIAAGAAAVLLLIATAIALYWRARRIRSALDAAQADRRALRATNAALEHEIEERRAAEKRAAKAQAELAQASKMAALGQLSASVTHELGQPLSAMRNFLVAAEIGASERDGQLLARLSGLVARMEAITRELRFFARPGKDALADVALEEVARGAMEMVEADARMAGVSITLEQAATGLTVRGDRLRLEQVLVNLLRNALAANAETSGSAITLRLYAENGQACIDVADEGPGLRGTGLAQMQEPFHTTRASGEGMGLGLAISTAILQEHGGWLRAADGPNGGAVFSFGMPATQPEGLAA